MHSIAMVSVQFVYFHLYVLCLVYDEYDNKAIIIIIIITAHLDPVGGHISIPSLGVAGGMLVNAHAECAPLFNLIDGTSNIGFRVSD